MGIAAREGNIKTFSHALPDWVKDKHFPYKDKTEYSQKVSNYHNLRDHFFITGEDEGILEPKRFYQKMKLPAGGSIRMRQYRRINHDYMPQRLKYCAITAQTHKIEYRYPLLDKRLVEFYLSLPSYMKAQNRYGRYILRRSTEGILPPEIQWRTDKTGIVVPSIFLRWKQDEKKIRQLILRAKESNIRHYIDYDKTLDLLEKIVHQEKDSKVRINPQAFQSSLMLLMYQLENHEQK